MNDQPIIVTGMPRSGLSLVAGFLAACGAWVPPAPARGRMPRYLNHEILIRVTRPIFRGLKASASGFGAIPKTEEFVEIVDEVAPTMRREVRRIVKEQGLGEAPWIYRSSDAVVAWPLWLRAFPKAVWVIVRRPIPAVIASCRKTGYTRGPRDEERWWEWAEAYRRKFDEIVVSNATIVDVHPLLWFSGNLSAPTALLDSVGIDASEERIRDALAPVLWASGVFSLGSGKGATG